MATFRDLIQNRKLKVGTCIGEFATSGLGQILKASGTQYVLLDMEHSGFSFETVKGLLRNLHDAGIATLLRPPSKETHHIARACDVGGQGILLPMLGSAVEAQAGVDAINYPPVGTRGCAFAIAHDDYQPQPVMDAINAANDKTCLVPLIETVDGVENCESIVAVPGVDAIWLGHFDLSASLGIPGEFDNPLFVEAVDHIMASANKAGVSVGRIAGSGAESKVLFDQGCDFICYLGDIWVFQKALKEGYQSITELISENAEAGRE